MQIYEQKMTFEGISRFFLYFCSDMPFLQKGWHEKTNAKQQKVKENVNRQN